MPREPLSRVPMMMRLPLRSRSVAIGRSPRVNTQIGSWNSRPDRAQLRVFGMPTFLLLGGEAPLQAADEVALDERRRDPGVVVDQGAQASGGPPAAAGVLRPSLSLTRVVRRTSTSTPYLRRSSLYCVARSKYCGVAGGDDDLALPVEQLRVVDNRQPADAEAGGEHRHRARLGDIRVHGAPPFCRPLGPCRLQSRRKS